LIEEYGINPDSQQFGFLMYDGDGVPYTNANGVNSYANRNNKDKSAEAAWAYFLERGGDVNTNYKEFVDAIGNNLPAPDGVALTKDTINSNYGLARAIGEMVSGGVMPVRTASDSNLQLGNRTDAYSGESYGDSRRFGNIRSLLQNKESSAVDFRNATIGDVPLVIGNDYNPEAVDMLLKKGEIESMPDWSKLGTVERDQAIKQIKDGGLEGKDYVLIGNRIYKVQLLGGVMDGGVPKFKMPDAEGGIPKFKMTDAITGYVLADDDGNDFSGDKKINPILDSAPLYRQLRKTN
jgi:hypothetical protein